MSITPAVLAKLGQFDTPTICNVIELFDVRPRNTGYMDNRIKCNFPQFPPMVGFASSSKTASPACCSVIAAASPFGPDPTTIAS